MLISVIVPIYNVEKHLACCLDSLALQTLPAEQFEVVMVNDATLDASAAIAEEYCKKYAHFTLVTHEKNMGLGAARNTGMRASKGDYYFFVDSDDFISRNALALFAQKQRENPSDAIFGAHELLSEAGEIQTKIDRYRDPNRDVRLNFVGWHLGLSACGVLFKASIQQEHSIWFKERTLHEDLVFVYKFICRVKEISTIEQTIYYYIRHQNSIVGTFKEKNIIDYLNAWAELKASDQNWNAELEADWRQMLLRYTISLLCSRALVFNAPQKVTKYFSDYLSTHADSYPHLEQDVMREVRLACESTTKNGRYSAETFAQMLSQQVVFCSISDEQSLSFAPLAVALEKRGLHCTILQFCNADNLEAKNKLPQEGENVVLCISDELKKILPFTSLCYITNSDMAFDEGTLRAFHRERLPVIYIKNGDLSASDNNFDLLLSNTLPCEALAEKIHALMTAKAPLFTERMLRLAHRCQSNNCNFQDVFTNSLYSRNKI